MSFASTLRDYQNLTAQQWLDRATKTLPRAVTVVLVVAIAWQLVAVTWLLLERKSADTPLSFAPPPPPTGAQPANQGQEVQTIVQAHLFGLPQAETNPVDAPVTQQPLVLSAVFASSDPAKGLAIIGESAAAAKVYAVGAAVRAGVKLHSVYPDKVLLDRSGSLESLMLPKQNTAGLQINRPPPLQTSAAAGPGPNQPFVDNLRRIANENPSAFAEIVRAQTVFDKGVLRGFRVFPGRNRQVFAKLGFQPGDLVTSINGTPLDDPQRAQEMFNTISASDRVTVMIERSGQPQELTLNTAQITLPESSPPSRAVPPGQAAPYTQPGAPTN